MKPCFSVTTSEGQILSPVLHRRTFLYKLRELLPSESKVLPGAPESPPYEQFSYQNTRWIQPQLDLCDFSSGQKEFKTSG